MLFGAEGFAEMLRDVDIGVLVDRRELDRTVDALLSAALDKGDGFLATPDEDDCTGLVMTVE